MNQIREKVTWRNRRICRDEVMKDKVSLPYVNATIREVQRIAAVAAVATPHALLEDTYIDCKVVPKHTVILCHLMSVLYDPTERQEPEKFRPERFLGEKGEMIKPEVFCPFSMGPRTCIGQQLASNEVFLFFTSFLQRFNCTKVNKDDSSLTNGERTGETRQPDPFQMCLKPI
ncbi:Cytochrome P450 2C23 [Mytilus coruscus]|uniref:Cytochrome P450 2C23 n=1 Tax=Mytilus coruscus TaxID=42192 RepID=A0A6J8BVQ9_MYTCO|nr:Cytochrome P450 2C23 [Mytilus coruscus]